MFRILRAVAVVAILGGVWYGSRVALILALVWLGLALENATVYVERKHRW